MTVLITHIPFGRGKSNRKCLQDGVLFSGRRKDWVVAGGREHTGSSRFRGRKAEEKQTWKMSWGVTLRLGHDRNRLVLLLRQAFLGTSPR